MTEIILVTAETVQPGDTLILSDGDTFVDLDYGTVTEVRTPYLAPDDCMIVVTPRGDRGPQVWNHFTATQPVWVRR